MTTFNFSFLQHCDEMIEVLEFPTEKTRLELMNGEQWWQKYEENKK